MSRPELEIVCRSALWAASPTFHGAPVEAAFHPYVGLSHTIRRRGRGWRVRISDHCADAPETVIEAIATLLACKVVRRRPPRAARLLYERYRREPALVERMRARRRARGRKRIDAVPGAHHALAEIFRDLSARHFGGRLEVEILGWGRRPSWVRLGHYDPVHHTITISRVLDSPEVPRAVVAYIVYHEMLHALFELRTPCRGGRHHPAEFRRAEREYPGYAAARRFLAAFCRGRGRLAAASPRSRARGDRPA